MTNYTRRLPGFTSGKTIATAEGVVIAETRQIDLVTEASHALDYYTEDELEQATRDYAEGITDEHGIHLGTREEYEAGAFADE